MSKTPLELCISAVYKRVLRCIWSKTAQAVGTRPSNSAETGDEKYLLLHTVVHSPITVQSPDFVLLSVKALISISFLVTLKYKGRDWEDIPLHSPCSLVCFRPFRALSKISSLVALLTSASFLKACVEGFHVAVD